MRNKFYVKESTDGKIRFMSTSNTSIGMEPTFRTYYIRDIKNNKSSDSDIDYFLKYLKFKKIKDRRLKIEKLNNICNGI